MTLKSIKLLTTYISNQDAIKIKVVYLNKKFMVLVKKPAFNSQE